MKYMCHVFLALFAVSASYAATVDLSTLTGNYEAQDSDVLTGTLNGNQEHPQPYKITIADGATVTLSDAKINGTNENICNDGSESVPCDWAGLTCLGNCTIVLSGSNTVKGFNGDYPGIQAAKNEGVGGEYTLKIEGDGSLDASSNGSGAGIGSGMIGTYGNIAIKGGTVTATGGEGAAGIGGGSGYEGKSGGITISGGNVTATGGEYAAGIGSGNLGTGGNITISGGEVAAVGGDYGAGIGSGENGTCGDITISGGTVIATGGDYGAGIGSGFKGTCGDISISGGKVTATGGQYAAGIGSGDQGTGGNITITNDVTKVVAIKGRDADYSIAAGNKDAVGTITLGETEVGAVQKSPFKFPSNVELIVDLSKLEYDYEAQDGDVLTGTLKWNSEERLRPYKITIADGAKVTLSDATINGNLDEDFYFPWAGLTCLGNCTIVLEGSNIVKGFGRNYPGIQAAKNEGEGDEYTLTIEGEGSLAASSNGYGAGIGGDDDGDCGNIIINGGNVTATGGEYAAGIGSGFSGTCGNIIISGGEVTATGGEKAAGIGSGFNEGTCGDITISGGKVTATGGENSAGIGSGFNEGTCGDIMISGGTVTATGGAWAAGLGAGDKGTSGDISISGGEVIATGGNNGAGIGSGFSGTCGNITISGGEVAAVGGEFGAGIGSGFNGTSGDISISGGEVIATGGEFGAGIGAGDKGTSGDISISGGEVIATGGNNGAGIGGGFDGTSGNITITNDVTKVVAIKGKYASYSIGAGEGDEAGIVTIGGEEKSPVAKELFVFPAPPATLVDFETVGNKTYAVVDGDYSGDAVLKIAKDVKVDKVIFDRTFPEIDGENNYSTIMFPFEINAEDVANVWQGFSFAGIGVDAENRKFVAVKEVDKFEAYKPYLIQLFPDVTKIFVNNAEPLVLKAAPTAVDAFDVAQSSDYNQYGDYVFRGVVQGKTWGAEDDDVLGTDGAAAYGFASATATGIEIGQFVKVGEGASIKPFRGYIYKKPAPKKVKSNGDYVLRQTASIDDLPDVMDIVVVDSKKDGSKQTTVIGQFNSRTGEIRMNRTKRTYDLKGRSVRDVSRMAKGVYFKK